MKAGAKLNITAGKKIEISCIGSSMIIDGEGDRIDKKAPDIFFDSPENVIVDMPVDAIEQLFSSQAAERKVAVLEFTPDEIRITAENKFDDGIYQLLYGVWKETSGEYDPKDDKPIVDPRGNVHTQNETKFKYWAMEQYGMTAEEYRGYTIEGTLKTLGEIDEATSKTMLILALPSIAKNAVKTAKDVAENGVHFDTSIALKAGGEAAEEGAKDTAENIAKKEIKETMTNGVFSNVNEAELKDRVRTHVFSQKHIKAGVLDLGNSQDNILDKGFDVVKTLDEKGLIKDGSTQIKTHIDGMEAEIRVFIKDGKIINLDMFKGHSGRDMGNTIYF